MITPMAQWIAGAVLLGASWLACAGDAGTWSLKQSAAGVVTATGPLPGAGMPRRQDFLLRLPDRSEISASEVSRAAAPGPDTWLALCIDHSGSMSASMPVVKQALDEALRGALPGPAAGLRVQPVAFGTRVQAAHDFSDDPETIVALVDALPSERARDGRTRLYDAMATALSNLRQAPDGAVKRLVVVSDGNDEGSKANAEVVERQALAHAVPVDVVAYGELAEASSPIMQSLTQVTKGEFVLANNPAELARALQAVLNKSAAAALVSVTFRYPPATDGSRLDSASLVHAPDGRAPVQHALRLDSAIAAPAPAVAAAGNGLSAALRPALALVAAALAVGVGMVLLKSRSPPQPPVPDHILVNVAPHPRRSTVISHAFAPPRPGQPAAYLHYTDAQQQGYRYPIEKELVRLGAAAGNDLVLSGDEYISGNHASIRYDVRNLYLQDLGSGNGTYLNNERLGGAPMALTPGDRIRLGATTLELRAA